MTLKDIKINILKYDPFSLPIKLFLLWWQVRSFPTDTMMEELEAPVLAMAKTYSHFQSSCFYNGALSRVLVWLRVGKKVWRRKRELWLPEIPADSETASGSKFASPCSGRSGRIWTSDIKVQRLGRTYFRITSYRSGMRVQDQPWSSRSSRV